MKVEEEEKRAQIRNKTRKNLKVVEVKEVKLVRIYTSVRDDRYTRKVKCFSNQQFKISNVIWW